MCLIPLCNRLLIEAGSFREAVDKRAGGERKRKKILAADNSSCSETAGKAANTPAAETTVCTASGLLIA